MPEKCGYCNKPGAQSRCAACKQAVYCVRHAFLLRYSESDFPDHCIACITAAQNKTCQTTHWKIHKAMCRRLADVRALAIAPLLEGRPGNMDATMLVSVQIYKHFEKRANDFLVYESCVRKLLNTPVEMFGWCKLRMRHVCCKEEHVLIYDGVDIIVKPEDRKYACYVVPTREEGEATDFGRWAHGDTRPLGSGTDEYTHRHPGTFPEEDEQVQHTGPTTEYSPITTKASQHLIAIAFVGDELTRGRLIASYKNQLAIRFDNSRRCLNYDCYEFKPEEGGRLRSEDPRHLPIPAQVNRYHDTITYKLPCGVKAVEEAQEVRTICHIKALTGDFCSSRCYRFRVPLDHISGIRLLQDYRDPPIDSTGSGFDDWDIPGVLMLEVSQPPDSSAFCLRTVAAADNSFKVTGDWTPDCAGSRAARHYIYGSFEELKELAAHMCVIDNRIAALFEKGGGSLEGDDLGYEHSTTLKGPATPPLSADDTPMERCFDGDLAALGACVSDRLMAMSEAGNHDGALFIAKNLGLTG
jgi:hypothetical protein